MDTKIARLGVGLFVFGLYLVFLLIYGGELYRGLFYYTTGYALNMNCIDFRLWILSDFALHAVSIRSKLERRYVK